MKRRNTGKMFNRLLFRSLQRRLPRLLLAGAAVVLGALLVAALSSLNLDIGSKIGKELRGYGANIVLSPRSTALAVGSGSLDLGTVGDSRYIDSASLAPLGEPSVAEEIAGYAPYLYGLVEVAGQQIVVAGTELDRVRGVSPWWKVTGRWVGALDGEGAMVGASVAKQLGLSPGDGLSLRVASRSQSVTVFGTIDTGAGEDNQIFVNLALAQELLGKPNAVSLVQVSALSTGRPIGDVSLALEQTIAGVQAKVIGQIADAEAAVFFKIQSLMALLTVLVLFAGALAVSSTMTTTVLERTKEIGLLKALGAGNSRIAGLFLAEAATVGVCGGIAGYLLGLVVAQIVARGVFQSALNVHIAALPLTLVVTVAVAVVASVAPVRRAVAVDPIVSLRGE